MRTFASAPALLLLLAACKGGPSNTVPTDDTGGEEQGASNIGVSASTLDFGIADDINKAIQKQLVIQNTGIGDLVISDMSASGPFSVASPSVTVAPQGSVQLNVTFVPTEYSDYTETLTITSNDADTPEVSVTLTGGVVVDQDGDGHDRPEAGGDDCDDENASTYPGATEVWYDGVDGNCNGDDDYDQDGDGWKSSTSYPDVEDGGGDCIDVNVDVYPGAEDTWYDGVDSDCAGDDDYDQDLDGYSSSTYGGSDCDDIDDQVFPGADERVNGKLDDCEGDVDLDVNANAADARWTGAANSQSFGSSLATGDVDGDGTADVFVGAQTYDSNSGGVAVFLSADGFPADGSTIEDASNVFDGSGSADYLGSAMVLVDDFDGNNLPDLAVAAYGANTYGRFFIIDSEELAAGDSGDAHTIVSGTSSYYRVGRGLGAADMDGDGLDDVFFHYQDSTSGSAGNYVGLVYGSSGGAGSVSASAVDATWDVGDGQGSAYEAMTYGSDLDGDGYGDWAYSDPWADNDVTNDGSVWVLWGSATDYSASGDSFDSDAERVMTGGSLERVGQIGGIVDDINGDGVGDVFGWAYDLGDVGILYGGPSLKGGGANDVSADSDVILDMSQSLDPTVIRAAGDWTGDGINELAVGFDGDGASTPGRLLMFDLAGGGTFFTADAMVEIQGSNDDANAYLTHAVPHRPADIDGDGDDDLLIGDYGWSGDVDGDESGESNAGAAYVFLNYLL